MWNALVLNLVHELWFNCGFNRALLVQKTIFSGKINIKNTVNPLFKSGKPVDINDLDKVDVLLFWASIKYSCDDDFTINPVKINPGTNLSKIKKAKSCIQHYSNTTATFSIILSGDVEENPGPGVQCPACNKNVNNNHKRLICSTCHNTCHNTCYATKCSVDEGLRHC